MEEKLQVYDEVLLECTAPWFQAPKALILPHNGRSFEVKASQLTNIACTCLDLYPFQRSLRKFCLLIAVCTADPS